jgi:hypothetical protein
MPLTDEEMASRTGMKLEKVREQRMKAEALRRSQMGAATGDASYQQSAPSPTVPQQISPTAGPAMLQMRMKAMGL